MILNQPDLSPDSETAKRKLELSSIMENPITPKTKASPADTSKTPSINNNTTQNTSKTSTINTTTMSYVTHGANSTPLKNSIASTPGRGFDTPSTTKNTTYTTHSAISTPMKTSMASTPGRGLNTPKRCSGKTKSGKTCKRITSKENSLCTIHDVSRG